MILLYLLHQNLQVTQFDVQGAFLHAPLTEEVFIKTPKGVDRDAPYLKLKKALYGLKQSRLDRLCLQLVTLRARVTILYL